MMAQLHCGSDKFNYCLNDLFVSLSFVSDTGLLLQQLLLGPNPQELLPRQHEGEEDGSNLGVGV